MREGIKGEEALADIISPWFEKTMGSWGRWWGIDIG